MQIEVLVIDGCPHVDAVLAALRNIADDRDDISVETSVIASVEEAGERSFLGSPTILIDGRDPFPATGSVAGLACRRYRLPGGGYGVPDEFMLRSVLEDPTDRSTSTD
jgi:hypothetical protein